MDVNLCECKPQAHIEATLPNTSRDWQSSCRRTSPEPPVKVARVTKPSLDHAQKFQYSGNMETNCAAQAFSTLGNPGRLAVFRLLMRFAPQGVRPTEIAEALRMKQNTLSHYLADLVAAGLCRVQRQGRSLYYAVDLDMAEGLISYLALDVGRARPDLLTPLLEGQKTRAAYDRVTNVLFICSRNSARSIFAEALLRDLGRGRFRSFSAGTQQNASIHPTALEILQRNGHDTSDLRSKHTSKFQSEGAPVMDFVFTVCDAAAAEDCPPWHGQPITGHWGLPDPAVASGTDTENARAFARTYAALHRRIMAFIALPLASLSPLSVQSKVDLIGQDAQTYEKG